MPQRSSRRKPAKKRAKAKAAKPAPAKAAPRRPRHKAFSFVPEFEAEADPSEPAFVLDIPESETAKEAVTRIAEDAVLILRRELAFQAELSLRSPGTMKMEDCIALLRLSADLGAAAMRGSEGEGAKADYSRLTPEERLQLAALLLKVDYLEAT